MKKCLLVGFVASLAHSDVGAQSLTLIGENYLLLNGERFKDQKISFTKAGGDWFATNNDSHGTIEFGAAYAGRNLTLDIEWDGKDEVHVITNEVRHQERKGDFIISMNDKNVYGDGLNAYPAGDEEIRIIIRSIDDGKVNGELSGSIMQGNEKVKVTGVFNLKKTIIPTDSKKIVTAVYKNCDNVVHDKLSGASSRSPSECEALYDLDVRTAIHNAFSAVIKRLEKEGWKVNEQTDLSPLTGVGRGSEKDIFNTTYDVKLSATPGSASFAVYQQKLSALNEKANNNFSKETIEEYRKVGHEMRGATQIAISVSVNNHSAGFSNFKYGAKLSSLPDNIYKIQSPSVQPKTIADGDESKDVTFLLIGKWKQPVIERSGSDGEQVKTTASINPSLSHLSAQNIIIKIECNQSLADEIIKDVLMGRLQGILK